MFEKIIIAFLFICFIGGQLLRIQIGNVAITALDIGVVGVGVAWLIYRIYTRSIHINLNQSEKLFIGFLSSGLIGLMLYSIHLSQLQAGIAVLYLVRLLFYVGIFYIVRSRSLKVQTSIKHALFLSGIVVLGGGLIQYFFYQALGNLRYLGWDEHLYRLFSNFLDPNFAGSFLVVFLLFTCELLIKAKTKLTTTFYSVIALITIISVVMTYSRTGFIMMLVGLGVFFLSYTSKKVVFAVIVGCIVLFLALANTKIEGLNPLRVVSSQERIKSASHALSIVQKYPIFGVGFNAYRYAQVEMGYRDELPTVQSHSDAGTDNSYLFVAATTGLVGSSFFGWFLFRVLKSLQTKTKSNYRFARSSYAGLIATLVGSLFLNILFYPMIVGWLLVEIALIRSTKS